MLTPIADRELLRPLLEQEPHATVRARSILWGLALPSVRMLVDDPVRPNGVLLSSDDALWDIYAPDPAKGRAMLDELDLRGRQAILAGIADHLVGHATRRFELIAETPTNLYLLEGAPRPVAVAHPSDRVCELALEDAEVVARAWSQGDFESPSAKLAYLRARIEHGPTAAVVREGRLASFALTHEDGSVGVLHTEPAHRGQGLGRLALTTLIRKVLHCDRVVYGFVARGNLASERLVESLGLRAVHRCAWLTVRG